jgi:hypothetical protein
MGRPADTDTDTKREPAPASEQSDLLAATDVFKRRFPHASGGIPYYSAVNRVLLPPDWKRPGLVVPLDGEYVAQNTPAPWPLKWLSEAFARDLDWFLSNLAQVKFAIRRASFPDKDIDGITPYFPNRFFGVMDASALTGLIRQLKPRRYVEIGSGNSTRFARHAIDQNGYHTKVICVDPAPRQSITNVAHQIIETGLLEVELSLFTSLEANDVLFFDGSHICFSGTDCARFFLEILPCIPPGVYVHVHDIFLPNDYPDRMKRRYYNEQHLLAAFLYNNRDFRVILPIHHLHTLGHCPEGVSFWMQRV